MVYIDSFIVGIVIIIIDLIVNGIVGIMKKSINMVPIVTRIIFAPLGIFTGFFSAFFSKDKKPEEGKLAIVASISCFAFAFMLIEFLVFFYIQNDIMEIIIPWTYIAIIVGMIAVIIFYALKR